jgi:hypothetical protein
MTEKKMEYVPNKKVGQDEYSLHSVFNLLLLLFLYLSVPIVIL